MKRVLYTLFESDPALAANQSDECTVKNNTDSRIRDPDWDVNRFLKNACPAGATSQDRTNLRRWKSPDRGIVINKTAGVKSSQDIKSRLFYLGGYSELSSHNASFSDLRAVLFPKTDEPYWTDYRDNCLRVTQHHSMRSQGIICLVNSGRGAAVKTIWKLMMKNVVISVWLFWI